MGISVMREGEVMGRGVDETKLQARTRARLKGSEFEANELIAIIGGGPAGLLAAHAVALAGRQPVVFTKPDEEGKPAKSTIGAATYLHEAIPDLTSATPDARIRFVKIGTRAGYALKVYGDRHAECSWEKFEDGHQRAWSLQPAYDDLWERYQSEIVPAEIGPDDVPEMIDTFSMVINTAPAMTICTGGHVFPSRTVWVTDSPGRAVDYGDPSIVYDGTVGTVGDRYRSSLIFGKGSTEYASEVPGSREGIKVLPTDCDCHPEVVRAGRWGEWKPGVLVNHAFRKVWEQMFDSFEGA